MDCRGGAYFPGVYRWSWYSVADPRVRFPPSGRPEAISSGSFPPDRMATLRGRGGRRRASTGLFRPIGLIHQRETVRVGCGYGASDRPAKAGRFCFTAAARPVHWVEIAETANRAAFWMWTDDPDSGGRYGKTPPRRLNVWRGGVEFHSDAERGRRCVPARALAGERLLDQRRRRRATAPPRPKMASAPGVGTSWYSTVTVLPGP
jgi:hypothetical protein